MTAPSSRPAAVLFDPLEVGAWSLSHRVVLAPFGRLGAEPDDATVTPAMVAFYAERATPGGLLVAEASAIAAETLGQRGMPGLFDAAQVNAWRAVTDAVHARGGVIVAQLWHGGRLVAGAAPPLGPSAIRPRGTCHAPAPRPAPARPPLPLDEDGIERVIDLYRQAAEHAADAGFDGVELHAANGCLIDQFLHAGSNRRADGYGGSLANRTRLLVDAVQALASVWGAERIGVRLSPYGRLNDVDDPDVAGLFHHLLRALDDEQVAYVHLQEPRAGGGLVNVTRALPDAARTFRPSCTRAVIASGGFDASSAAATVRSGLADAIGFGRCFLRHPDLPQRLAAGLPLHLPDPSCFFLQGGHAPPPGPAARRLRQNRRRGAA